MEKVRKVPQTTYHTDEFDPHIQGVSLSDQGVKKAGLPGRGLLKKKSDTFPQHPSESEDGSPGSGSGLVPGL